MATARCCEPQSDRNKQAVFGRRNWESRITQWVRGRRGGSIPANPRRWIAGRRNRHQIPPRCLSTGEHLRDALLRKCGLAAGAVRRLSGPHCRRAWARTSRASGFAGANARSRMGDGDGPRARGSFAGTGAGVARADSQLRGLRVRHRRVRSHASGHTPSRTHQSGALTQ